MTVVTSHLSAFMLGLLGGVHCVSMCGGIVGALLPRTEPSSAHGRQWPLHLSYSVGRIGSYTAIGAFVGAFGLLFKDVQPVSIALFVLANLMLIALGLYLTGFTRLLAPFERGGQVLWRYIQPLTKRFLPVRSVAQALPLGVLWGFLPCGMVYSVLFTALATGSAAHGAGLMLVFGLGTLPNLLLAGWLVLCFGVYGLVRVPSLRDFLWKGVMCE